MDSELQIRPATLEDVDKVWRVRAAAWEQAYSEFLPALLWAEEGYQGYAERWPTQLEKRGQFFVGERAGQVVGYSAVGINHDSPDEPSPYMVHALYVHPEVQGSGVGRQLMVVAVEWLVNQGADSIGIAAFSQNPKAQGIYRSWGARLVDQGTFEVLGVPYPDERFIFDDPVALLEKLRR